MLRFSGLAGFFVCTIAFGQQFVASGRDDAPHRGVYEVRLNSAASAEQGYLDIDLEVEFTAPGGAKVKVGGFYDGGNVFKARAYCGETGLWQWRSFSSDAGLNGKSGAFRVTASGFKGKLRRHPKDPRQFAYDNGEWFLHIGDTGYRYVTASEPHWKAYIDQAAEMGITKVRTWFAQSRGNVEALFDENRTGLALPYWQEIERRILYALNRHPNLILQLIPYAEDTEEIKRYAAGDRLARLAASYAQARWSAFPNVQWTISNDREIVRGKPLTGRLVDWEMIDRIGRDMAAREPWGTLITNHQARYTGYDFVDAPWSDFITLEDLDQVGGEILLKYREKRAQPVVNDEDRYELYRHPANRRYFFRRLMWASLLSGGHATYGGLRTYEPYDTTGARGVSGYYDANRAGLLFQGGHDFVNIHKFFLDTRLTLVGMMPDDAMAGGNPRKWKCIRDERTIIAYLANPDGDRPGQDNPAVETASVELRLPEGSYSVRWFDPRTGNWVDGPDIQGGVRKLEAPMPVPANSGEDWVLLLRRL
jgi:hypothetical protein